MWVGGLRDRKQDTLFQLADRLQALLISQVVQVAFALGIASSSRKTHSYDQKQIVSGFLSVTSSNDKIIQSRKWRTSKGKYASRNKCSLCIRYFACELSTYMGIGCPLAEPLTLAYGLR